MRKVIIIQHEAFEVLGTLDPLLKREKFRIRYVNFERDPHAQVSLEKYNGLIIMGGYMGVYESDKYHHIKAEIQLIEEALKKNIPILGICLGSQILAHVLGSHVRKHVEREMGWYDLHLTDEGVNDPILNHFNKTEKVFQSHGDVFDVPKTATHLAWSELCQGQAFRYGDKVYGLQFHLEVDEPIIREWLITPENQEIFKNSHGRFAPTQIQEDTRRYVSRSVNLSIETFTQFTKLFAERKKTVVLGSGHGKSN